MGSDTTQFTVDYSGADIVIVDSWTARVLIGGGVTTNSPNVECVLGGGSLIGTMSLFTPPVCLGDANFDNTVDFADITSVLTFFGTNYGSGTGPGDADRSGVVDFADITSVLTHFGATCSPMQLQGSSTIALNTNGAEWREIFYPDGVGGMAGAVLGPSPPSILIHRNSLFPNPSAPSAEQLTNAVSTHYALLVRVAENAQAASSAPTTVRVTLVAYNSSGTEIDRLNGLTLTKLENDGDPANILYATELSKPVIVLDQSVERASYPQFMLLFGYLFSPLQTGDPNITRRLPLA
jgi:hypothetical protein